MQVADSRCRLQTLKEITGVDHLKLNCAGFAYIETLHWAVSGLCQMHPVLCEGPLAVCSESVQTSLGLA